MKIFKKTKKDNIYTGLSESEKKKIASEAIKKANEEQAEVVSKYGVKQHSGCHATR